MSNYKIRVNSKAESKETQELFVVLGAVCCSGLERNKNVNFLFMESGFLTACKLQENFDKSKCKEITLPELRDLVVLKRNDVGDATHEDYSGLKHLLLTHTRHVWGGDNWLISTADFSKLKPITKEEGMKEYLNKETHVYVKTHELVSKDSNWIEIPDGAEAYLINPKVQEFLKNINGGMERYCGDDWRLCLDDNISLIDRNFNNIVWQRPSHPEELPFIDDEPKYDPNDIDLATGYDLDVIARTHGYRNRDVQESCLCYRESLKIFIERKPSLNDQYAEIEKVRQSAWAKQEGGSHYKNLKIQPMQYALENKLDYAQANVVKYVTRHKEKNGKEDLLKAIHNIELMIEFYYGDEK